MDYKLTEILKKYLPRTLVCIIKSFRKSLRNLRRYSINFGNDVLVTLNIESIRFKIFLNPYKNGGVDEDVYAKRSWEPEVMSKIKSFLPRDGIFFDVGANIGVYSLFASRIMSEGRVYAFEPIKRIQTQLAKSIKENNIKNISLEPFALSDRSGTYAISLVQENIGASSLQDVSLMRDVQSTEVIATEMMDVFLNKIDRLDVIKMDIEGNEFEALRGGEHIVRKFKPIMIIEFSPHLYEKDYQGKSLELFYFIKSLGYDIGVIENQLIDIEERLKNSDFSNLHCNLLCSPN